MHSKIFQIRANEIDYTQIKLPLLRSMEEEKLYPPHYVISISGANVLKSDTLVLNFTGSLEPFTTEVILELPVS